MLAYQIRRESLLILNHVRLREGRNDQLFLSFTQPFFTGSFLNNLRASILGLTPQSTEHSERASLHGNEPVKRARLDLASDYNVHVLNTVVAEKETVSLKNTFADVSVILKRFPAGNQAASLQSLAEIGALFPDVAALRQFQRSEIERTHVITDIQQHLLNVQLRLVHQLSPATALNVYKALAALRFAAVEEIYEALFSIITSNADNLSLSDVASFLQATLMFQPDINPATENQLLALLSSALAQSKKRHVKEAPYIVHVLYLLAQHNLRNSKVLEDLVDYLKARIKGLSKKDLISVVDSFRRLEYSAEKLFDVIVVEVLQRGTDNFCLKDLSKLAAALTEIKHFDVMTDVLMDSIAVSCQKRMNTLQLEELVNLLWAYAHHMHFHHDAKLLASLSNGLVAQLDSAHYLNAEMCVKLCEAVSACDLGSDTCCRILTTVAEQLVPSISAMSKTKLLAVATGCLKARFVCDQLLGSLRDAFESRSEELSSSDLCRVLNNFASLNFNPGDKLLDLALLKANRDESLSSTELARLMWSLTFFDKLTIANSKPLFRHLESFSRLNFSAMEIQKLLLSEKLILLLNKEASTEEITSLIPEPLRSELVAVWRERIQFNRSISPFQQEISRALNKMNIFHEAEAIIDNGDLSVDFLLYLGSNRLQGADPVPESGTTVVLECDGARRLSVNPPHRPLGQTLSFKRLLKAQGWRVHVISKSDWYKKSPDEQELLLKTTLKLQ